MTTTHDEITALEERLVQAELGPDARFFEVVLAEDVSMVGGDGSDGMTKAKIVKAHQPGAGPKFTRVEMKDMRIIDHGAAAVVTCKGTYESAKGSFTLRFMRVWLKREGRWQIIAGSVTGPS